MADFTQNLLRCFQEKHRSLDETMNDVRFASVPVEAQETAKKVWQGVVDYTQQSKMQVLGQIACQQNPYLLPHVISKCIPQNDVRTFVKKEIVKEAVDDFIVKDGKVYCQGKVVCNFWIQLTGYTVYRSEKEKRRKTYDLRITAGNKTATCRVTPKDLKREEYYTNLPDFSNIVFYNKPLFQKYISSLLENFDGEMEVVYDFSGWHKIHNRLYYVTSDGVVGEQMKVRAQGDLKLHPATSLDASGLWEGIKTLLGLAGDAGLIMLLYLVQNLMYSFYELAGVAPKFILFVVGNRNAGKTSVALNLFKMSGREAGTQKSDYNFLSTPAGLEQGIKNYHDAVMLCDDLMPSADSKSRAIREGNLELLVRVFGDGTEKKRNTDFFPDEIAAKIDYRAKGGCVVTGEYFAGVESSLTRMVILELSRNDIRFDLLSISQNNPRILLDFVYDFLCFATEKQDEIMQYMKMQIPKIRLENEGKYAAARYAENFATLYVAAQILIEYLKNRRFIDHAKGVELSNHMYAALSNVMQKNSEILCGYSSLYVISSAIAEYYLASEAQLHPNSGCRSSEKEILADEEFIYLQAEVACKVVMEWQKNHDIQKVFQSTRFFLRECDNCGLIYVATEGDRRRLSHKLPKHYKDNRRYVKFYKEKILQEYDNPQNM